MKVVLSRPDDNFVALEDRASKANKSDAKLFISIHINSSRSTSPNGYSVHILGQSSNRNKDLFAYNMDVCKRENSVVLLENDYSTKYQGFDPSDPESFIFMQLMQNSHLEQSLEFAQYVADNLAKGPITANRGIWQNPFLVLWRTAMPAVLVELGFISNSNDLSQLRLESNRDKIAECLKNAFVAYKAEYDASVNLGSTAASGQVAATEGPENRGNGPSVAQPAPETTNNEAAGAASATEGPLSKLSGPSAAAGSPEAVKSNDTAEKRFRYGTQIMSGSKKLDSKDSVFAGYVPEIVKVGETYKYILGVSTSETEAVENFQKIRKKFTSAFMVKYSDSDLPVPYRPAAKK